jgi:acetylornithine deacetylase
MQPFGQLPLTSPDGVDRRNIAQQLTIGMHDQHTTFDALPYHGNVLTTVELLHSLVAFATESRTPNRDLLTFAAEHTEPAGGRVQWIEGPEGRANLLISFGPDRPGGLLLAAHTDVVPAGSGWATPPYDLTAKGDRLFGRGTADMKGFLAATLHVLAAMDGWTAPLHLALSFDEEVGCAGMPSMLKHLGAATNVRPELVVVGEPTMMIPRHRHLGKLAYELTLHGTAGHSSRSPEIPSTITSAARIAVALDHLQTSFRSADPMVPHEITVNVGTIAGGTALNVIAECCTLSFELRHAPERDPDQALATVFDVIEREGRVLADIGGGIDMVEVTRYPGLATATDHPLVKVIERIADGGPCQAIGYGTEGGLYAGSLGVPVVICGPGDIAVAHRPDEYVSLEQLDRCERFLRSLIEHLCIEPGP